MEGMHRFPDGRIVPIAMLTDEQLKEEIRSRRVYYTDNVYDPRRAVYAAELKYREEKREE